MTDSSPCNLRDDGATVTCSTCGIAWASDARVRPSCPFSAAGPVRVADGRSRINGWLVVVLCVGLVINAALGVAILRAMP
jgi:hypothetical protein